MGNCNCESSFCEHHGGNAYTRHADESSYCDRCTNQTGKFIMAFVGAVCDECAKVAIDTGGSEYITESVDNA